MKVTERWHSDRMGQDISLARWGHYGVPVLVFPTAGGDAEEIERHQLVGHLEPLIEAGRIKVYSCDSAAGQAMLADDGLAEHRCGCSTSSSRRSPTRWSRRSTPTSAATAAGRRGRSPRSARSTPWP